MGRKRVVKAGCREDLIERIESLKKEPVSGIIDARAGEFKAFCNAGCRTLFKEMCFCFLTANYSAQRGIMIHESIGDGFIDLPPGELAARMKELGHRYPNARSAYVVEARKHVDSLKDEIDSHTDQRELREWIVANVKGLGFKEASHFLRNIGYDDLAIIDFHITDLLESHGVCERPKTLSKKKYLEIEDILRGIARDTGLNLARLDLYLWYMETGKVLK